MVMRVSDHRRASLAGSVGDCTSSEGRRGRHRGLFGGGADGTVGGARRRDFVRTRSDERGEACEADDDGEDLRTPHGRDLQRR